MSEIDFGKEEERLSRELTFSLLRIRLSSLETAAEGCLSFPPSFLCLWPIPMTPPIIVCLPLVSPGSVPVPVPQDRDSPVSSSRQKPKGEGWGRASGREPGWLLSEARDPGCPTFYSHKIPHGDCLWKAQKLLYCLPHQLPTTSTKSSLLAQAALNQERGCWCTKLQTRGAGTTSVKNHWRLWWVQKQQDKMPLPAWLVPRRKWTAVTWHMRGKG